MPMIRKLERIRFQVAQVINYLIIATKRGSIFFCGKLSTTLKPYMGSCDALDVEDITESDLEELQEERDEKRRVFKSSS